MGADEFYLQGNGPFKARSASDRTDDWPLWYVAGPDKRTNVLRAVDPEQDKFGPKFTDRKTAEIVTSLRTDKEGGR